MSHQPPEDSPLRYFPAKIAVAALIFLAHSALPARAETVVRLKADHVAFYYDRFLVEADGGVRVSVSDGTTITGQSFSMDLKLNRFVVAGSVHVSSPAGSQDGAALADFLDFNRVYFVPILPFDPAQGDKGLGAQGNLALSNRASPDRWTFVDGDYAHPAKGRQMPGDTFFLPDLGVDKPYLTGTSVVIGARSFVRFGASKVDLANGLGAYIPVPSYYVNFSSDQHLAQNSLSGANFDATYPLAGNANSVSALHFRYDLQNKTFLAFEQHLSGRKAYAVFSVNPLTLPSKFWNLILSDQPSDDFQIRTFTQLHTFQFGLSQPIEAQQNTTIQLTKALRQSYLQATYQFVDFNLLAPTPKNYYGDITHGIVPFHPSNLQITATSFQHPLPVVPLDFSMRYGMGFHHDSYGLQNFGGVEYTTVWQHDVGLTLSTRKITIGDPQGSPGKLFYINAQLDKDRQWSSIPHYIDTTNTTISLSRFFDRHVSSYVQYAVNNVGDIYGRRQSEFYPGFAPIIDGVTYSGYNAFHGLATLRTLSLSATYVNADDFSLSVLLRKHTDFPSPIPFFFSFAPRNVLGQQVTANFLGQPPYDVTGDLRMRINPHMVIDLQRSYYFNYSNLRWSPQFVIQVSQ